MTFSLSRQVNSADAALATVLPSPVANGETLLTRVNTLDLRTTRRGNSDEKVVYDEITVFKQSDTFL